MIIDIDEEQRFSVVSDERGGVYVNVQTPCIYGHNDAINPCRCDNGWRNDPEAGLYVPANKLNNFIQSLKAFNIFK
jgi:hypothetical protein